MIWIGAKMTTLTEIGEEREHEAIGSRQSVLDCVSERHIRDTERRGPYTYQTPSGWILVEARFIQTHRRDDAGVDPFKRLSRGGTVTSSSRIEEAYDRSIEYLGRLLHSKVDDENKRKEIRAEIESDLRDTKSGHVALANSAASSHDAVEFYLYAKGRGVGALVIPPFLRGLGRRIYAAILSFWAGVIPPLPMLGRSLL